MGVVGRYLNQEQVNCVLFVMDPHPRINITLNRLINIIVTKVHPDDHIKLALVINRYRHDQYNKDNRVKLNGCNEATSQANIKDHYLKAFSGMTSCRSLFSLSTV